MCQRSKSVIEPIKFHGTFKIDFHDHTKFGNIPDCIIIVINSNNFITIIIIIIKYACAYTDLFPLCLRIY